MGEDKCPLHFEPEHAKSTSWSLHVEAQIVIARLFRDQTGCKVGGGRGSGDTNPCVSPTHPTSPSDPRRASGKNADPADHGTGPSLVTERGLVQVRSRTLSNHGPGP